MNLYFAPMEGVNGYIYRNAYHRCFGEIDQYFTPFLSPNQNHKFSSREWNDVLPEHNEGMPVVPQLLTNRAEDFIWAAGELKKMGYEEVNLNLGCPSGTVVSKGKGAGFLRRPAELSSFLDQVYEAVDIKVSVKTRIGIDQADEFEELLQLFNRFPIHELIIHPRVRKDFYKNHPNLSVFRKGLEQSRNPVCYNGDIFRRDDYDNIISSFPEVCGVMIGRGIIANPGLTGEIRGKGRLHKDRVRELHDQVLNGYCQIISGDKNVLFKMKELWAYMLFLFPDSASYARKIRKADHLPEYTAAVDSLFRERELDQGAGFPGTA